jgi:hypothetical protein
MYLMCIKSVLKINVNPNEIENSLAIFEGLGSSLIWTRSTKTVVTGLLGLRHFSCFHQHFMCGFFVQNFPLQLFLHLHFKFVLFWCKNICAKATQRIYVKLTHALRKKNCANNRPANNKSENNGNM